MADLVVVAANVVQLGSSNKFERGFAGVALTAGQIGYKDAADGLIRLADCDSVTAGIRDAVGPIMNSAGVGQPVTILVGDGSRWNPGAAVVAANVYCLSDTPGGIMPHADMDSGDKLVLLAYADSDTSLTLMLKNTGVAKA